MSSPYTPTFDRLLYIVNTLAKVLDYYREYSYSTCMYMYMYIHVCMYMYMTYTCTICIIMYKYVHDNMYMYVHVLRVCTCYPLPIIYMYMYTYILYMIVQYTHAVSPSDILAHVDWRCSQWSHWQSSWKPSLQSLQWQKAMMSNTLE